MTDRLQKAPIAHGDKLYIGGDWVAAADDRTIEVIDSATEEPFARVAEASVADVEKAVAAARQAFDRGPWARLTPLERAPYLKAIAAGIEKRATEIASVWVMQSGVIFPVALAMVQDLVRVWNNHADLAATFPFVERHAPSMGAVGLLVREPVGVVAAIIPWNGTPLLISHKLAPAMLAGCTTILKSSPEAPIEGYIFAEICEAAGVPPGVVNVLTADRDVSEALVRHPLVDKVTFTGSTAAGRRIAAICGDRIARCTLELGGKSAAVILDDYDIGTAATTISSMATLISGQVCSSLTRIIIPRRRHDAMVDALASTFGSAAVGDPFADGVQMGPLATARQRDRVEDYIAKGRAEGAIVAAGGERPSQLNRGYFVAPTVFGSVDNRSTIGCEEIFGPVLSVIPADDEAHAVALANDTPYGLNNSVFTNDPDRAYAVARELRSGTVGHNVMQSDFGIAFGGFKQSGIGREGGAEGLRHFLEAKTIILDAEPAALAIA